MRIFMATLIALFCFSSFLGCSKSDSTAGKAPRVSATKAFETYFGPAPTTQKGTCYAFLIFFPSAKEPGKVVPFPFFTFDEATIKDVALRRQIGGMSEKVYAGQFLQPFPPGVRLVSVSQQGGIVTANYSSELQSVTRDKTVAAALYNAISLTLLQFNGVTGVRIQSDGKDLFPPDQAPPAASAVLQPAPPRLLNVVAMKETAVAPIGEIDVIFDRPVDVKEFLITGADGTPIKGDVFHSMFDMAAVVKPKEPAKLAAGSKVKVRWSVVDKVGRSANGEDVIPLQVTVHQD